MKIYLTAHLEGPDVNLRDQAGTVELFMFVSYQSLLTYHCQYDSFYFYRSCHAISMCKVVVRQTAYPDAKYTGLSTRE